MSIIERMEVKMIIKKITAYICVVAMSLSVFCPVYAGTVSDESTKPTLETAPYTIPSNSEDAKVEETVEKIFSFNAESAVAYGLKNNKSISILENKIQLAMIATQNASSNSNDLKDAENLLQDAASELFDKQKQLGKQQEQINAAESALANGIAPQAIPFVDSDGNSIVINAGSNIVKVLIDNGYSADTADDLFSTIKKSIEASLSSNQDTIDEYSIALQEAQTTLETKQDEFEAVLDDTSDTLDTKINYGSLINLDADDASDLMIKMAGVNLDVTRYAKGIYRNQIAMLIKKNYYDALYAEKIFELKKVAMERGEIQYNMVKLSYENGMKAKDDLLLSKMYYDSTVISCRLAESTYKNAIFELKENMNLDMDTEITLEDSMFKEVTEENLEDGLKSGLTNRIEIQQTLGQLAIYELNEDILNSSSKYRKNTKGIKEAKLLKEGAELQLDKTKTTVKSEINQSYETMVAAGEMLEASNDLINNAKEVVTIANLKYEQGFGAENTLLKQMNLQESSGTIIELIAVQENLSNIEAQVAQIRYGYTMAKVKYYNDAGILIY